MLGFPAKIWMRTFAILVLTSTLSSTIPSFALASSKNSLPSKNVQVLKTPASPRPSDKPSMGKKLIQEAAASLTSVKNSKAAILKKQAETVPKQTETVLKQVIQSAEIQGDEDVPHRKRANVPWRKTIVVIDPGHGGSEVGAVWKNLMEKDINLDMGLELGKRLEQEGIRVLYTRKTDTFVSLKDRADFANMVDADLFISVHNNSIEKNLTHRGTETLFSLKPDYRGRYGITEKELANLVQNELVSSLKTPNQGIKYRPNLAVLRRTKMPAIIAEVAFISNKQDRALLTNSNFRKKAANSIKEGTIKALKQMGRFSGK